MRKVLAGRLGPGDFGRTCGFTTYDGARVIAMLRHTRWTGENVEVLVEAPPGGQEFGYVLDRNCPIQVWEDDDPTIDPETMGVVEGDEGPIRAAERETFVRLFGPMPPTTITGVAVGGHVFDLGGTPPAEDGRPVTVVVAGVGDIPLSAPVRCQLVVQDSPGAYYRIEPPPGADEQEITVRGPCVVTHFTVYDDNGSLICRVPLPGDARAPITVEVMIQIRFTRPGPAPHADVVAEIRAWLRREYEFAEQMLAGPLNDVTRCEWGATRTAYRRALELVTRIAGPAS